MPPGHHRSKSIKTTRRSKIISELTERFRRFGRYSSRVLNRTNLKEKITDSKIIPKFTEGCRKFGRYSSRVFNRSKAKETADFNFVTDFKEEKCSIIWRIENIHRCTLKFGEFLESPAFFTRFGGEVKWTLRMYPKGRKNKICGGKQICVDHCEPCESASLFINKVSADAVISSFRCRLSYKRDLLNAPKEGANLSGSTEIEIDSTFGTDELFCTESLKLPQTLLVRCEISVTTAYIKETSGNYMPGISQSCSLYQDLKEMYESGKFSDVTVQGRDVQFHVHKAILASRSEVFDNMFQHDMKESQTNIVKIEDFEPEVVRNMIQYIYTGSVDDFNVEKAMPLYSAADKYFLKELKEWCADAMMANLTPENVCQVAVLAELHPDPKLKKAAFNVFRNHTSEIFMKKEWHNLVQDPNQHALVSSILQAVSADFTTNCHE